MAEEACISSNVIEIDEYRDFWCEGTRPVFKGVPFTDDRDRFVNSLLIGTLSSNWQRHVRNRRLAMRSGSGQYLLQVLTPGTTQDDSLAADTPATIGDICIFDLAQAPERQFATRSTLSIIVSRQLLEKAIGPQSLHGVMLKAHWPMTPLVVDYLRSLCTLKTQLPDVQAIAAQEALAALLAAALKGDTLDDGHAAPSLGARLRQSIVDFVARNLYLPELSPDFLCRRFNVSRAHLYRAFAADGGVAKVLRDMRLDAAYGELTDTGRTPRSITEIAYNLGFSSAGQLLRSFRTRFGITPREARAHACAPVEAKLRILKDTA